MNHPYREPVVTVEECRSCQLKRMRKAARVKQLKTVGWPIVRAMSIALPWCLMWAQHEVARGKMVEESYAVATVLLVAAGWLGHMIRTITNKSDAD